MNSQTRRSNSSQFSWLLVVLNNNLDLIAICSSVKTNPRLFVSICVPPNNPITACGATSFPGYHSFPKWAIKKYLRSTSSLDRFQLARTKHNLERVRRLSKSKLLDPFAEQTVVESALWICATLRLQ